MAPSPPFPVFHSLPQKIQVTCLDFSQQHNFLSAGIKRSVCTSSWRMTSATIAVLGMVQMSPWHTLPRHMEQLLQCSQCSPLILLAALLCEGTLPHAHKHTQTPKQAAQMRSDHCQYLL